MAMGPEISHEQATNIQAKEQWIQETRNRRSCLEDLFERRDKVFKDLMKKIITKVGPQWYQTLSVPQRHALDNLSKSIYQDLLEGRPVRVKNVVRELGIHPVPNSLDLMCGAYRGRDNAAVMIAHLYENAYGHSITAKRFSYPLNARLMLSSILYLSMDDMIQRLDAKFKSTYVKPQPESKPKPKPEPPTKSPYQRTIVSVAHTLPKKRSFQPLPLPNLDDLNEPCEEPETVVMPPATMPPPMEPKKPPGMNLGKTKRRWRKPRTVPTTGIANAQYHILGVAVVNGRAHYNLGAVTILPTNGDLIHGGNALVRGLVVNIHNGYRARPPPPKPDPCDCDSKWQKVAFEHVKDTKCRCGHRYDYYNEGTFSSNELPFFHKPTPHLPFQFDYQTIYELDEKRLHVQREFKKLWDTDSMLKIKGTDAQAKKKKKKGTTDGLGDKPGPQDYLRCAFNGMRDKNMIATLPDAHVVPELVEWMRFRLEGPLSRHKKRRMLRDTEYFFEMLKSLERKFYGHVPLEKVADFYKISDWLHKAELVDMFAKFTTDYKLKVFRSQARLTNILWPAMFQASLPDKKFREIYYSYLPARLQDMHIIRPYNVYESHWRQYQMELRQRRCPPDGVEQRS